MVMYFLTLYTVRQDMGLQGEGGVKGLLSSPILPFILAHVTPIIHSSFTHFINSYSMSY